MVVRTCGCRHFELRAFGDLNLYVVCDLDDAVLTIVSPPFADPAPECGWLALSPNLEERRAFEGMLARAEIGSETRVVHLLPQEVDELRLILDDESLKLVDGLDDLRYEAASDGWGFRDGWSASFVAYGTDGSVLAATQSLSLWFPEGRNAFALLESWLERKFGIYGYARISRRWPADAYELARLPSDRQVWCFGRCALLPTP